MPRINKSIFRLPTKPSIAGRASSITNAFIAAVMPIHAPTTDEVAEALAILDMTPETVCCAYCGGRKTEWDHLNAFVMSREPAGYFTSIHNLVPACGKCNQSKGNKNWRKWMQAKHVGQVDLERRVERLRKYEEWGNLTPLPVKNLLGAEEWDRYMKLCERIIQLMQEADKESQRLKTRLEVMIKRTAP